MKTDKKFRFYKWQGWPTELWNVAVAIFVVYAFDARWWWKVAVMVVIQIIFVFVREFWRAYRRSTRPTLN